MSTELEAFVRDAETSQRWLNGFREMRAVITGSDSIHVAPETIDRLLALLADRDAKLAAVRATIGRIIDQGQGSLRGDIGSPLEKGLLAQVECAGAFAQDIGDVAQMESAVVVEAALRDALMAVSHVE